MAISHRIDPLAMIQATVDSKFAQSTPKGSSFHTKQNILPYILLKLKEELTKAKTDATKTKAIEVLLEKLNHCFE